ncbi:TPA: CPBP family intramembrane metalloprotease [Candidatus Bathyarchaeota archaeon]|nr:CPBP family intramembrane metalloprotease [Candidatus Bathyarchaeota archaeon]
MAKVGDRSANPLFYVFALFGAALTVVPAVYAGAQLSGTGANWIDPSQWYTILVNFGYFLVFGALGGELGWRGFALPRLQRDAVAFVSGLVLGLVWGLWQAPLWYMEGRLVSVYFLLFLLQAMGFSVLYTWLYNNTDGNLLIIGLFHAASGTTLYALPVLPTATGGDTTPMLISLGLLWVMVAAVTVVYGPTYLSRKKKYTIFGEFSWEYED